MRGRGATLLATVFRAINRRDWQTSHSGREIFGEMAYTSLYR
jgi:hypothetical protein